MTIDLIKTLCLTALTVVLQCNARPPVRDLDSRQVPAGLDGRVIALWNSHGLYYNADRDQWICQRAPLNTTVEDVYTSTYILDLLAPMLENAGAYVMIPRERDTSTDEIIVDNSEPQFKSTGKWRNASTTGYKPATGPITDDVNPMIGGDALMTDDPSARATWNGVIPHGGTHTLYVCYPPVAQAGRVTYTVHTSAGDRHIEVDQTMGAGTWLRLGEFELDGTVNPTPLVTLSPSTGKIAVADAIRIGGGMGSVARGDENPTVSGAPRWTEGARYWLQYSGFPKEVYTPEESETDYTDDIRCRPLWVNYLSGGSARNPRQPGLNIPVDLALALHTDAGVTPDTTIVGTLGIYCTDGGRRLGDGRRRTVNKQLTETVVDQIVNDIRQLYQPGWVKRKIRDRRYAEARYGDVPSTLIELLSHQNYADMTLGLDPQFRFDASRAIYKGILRFLYSGQSKEPVIQPLAPVAPAVESLGNGKYRLSWLPQPDPLEPSAIPDRYIVECRKGVTGPFTTLTTTAKTAVDVEINDGQLMSYRIVALNDGGRSMPSETVAAGRRDNEYSDVTIVNGFTRISAPERFDDGEEAGFIDGIDFGVPDTRSVGYIGSQYDYDRSSEWTSDDLHPGHGASYTGYFGKIVAGNTRDYAARHGAAIMASGRGFTSSSLEGYLRLDSLRRNREGGIIDLILGKQREVTRGNVDPTTRFKAFPPRLQGALRRHLSRGGSLLVSGSNIVSDLLANEYSNDSTLHADRDFANATLGISLAEPYTASTGTVGMSGWWANGHDERNIRFNTSPSPAIYHVESPDALSSSRANAEIIAHYEASGHTAAISIPADGNRGGVTAYGFPLETVEGDDNLASIMSAALLSLSPERLSIAKHIDFPLPAIDPIDVETPVTQPPIDLLLSNPLKQLP